MFQHSLPDPSLILDSFSPVCIVYCLCQHRFWTCLWKAQVHSNLWWQPNAAASSITTLKEAVSFTQARLITQQKGRRDSKKRGKRQSYLQPHTEASINWKNLYEGRKGTFWTLIGRTPNISKKGQLRGRTRMNKFNLIYSLPSFLMQFIGMVIFWMCFPLRDNNAVRIEHLTCITYRKHINYLKRKCIDWVPRIYFRQAMPSVISTSSHTLLRNSSVSKAACYTTGMAKQQLAGQTGLVGT